MWKRHLAFAAILLAILVLLTMLAPRLYNFATTGIFSGQALSFTTIDQGDFLRGGSQLQTPTLHVIANAQDVGTLAQTVLTLDPQFYDKQQQIVDQLSKLDYNRSFAVLYQIRLKSWIMWQLWPPMEQGAIAYHFRQLLQLAATLGLHLDQFAQIVKVTIGDRLIAELPQVLGRL